MGARRNHPQERAALAPGPSPTPPIHEGSGPLRTIDSTELFGEDREVLIRHEGRIYRLRLTRQSKLILMT